MSAAARTTSATAADDAFLADIRSAAMIAGEHADSVDDESRFPHEAMDALRRSEALGAYIDPEFGGLGVSFDVLCTACFELARRCSATGMIFAMHQIQVASITRHLGDSTFFRDYLRALAAEQRLIASATSEVGTGGDLRTSIAAVEPAGEGRVRFEKQASTVSYGLHAEDHLTTVRRAPDSERSDQVIVLTRAAESGLEQTTPWDTLGMRGTCSPAFVMRAEFAPEQVVPGPFAPICAETVVPFSHILWSHGWLGTAFDALERAQKFMRGQARSRPGELPTTALRFSKLVADYAALRAVIHGAAADYSRVMDEPGRETLSTIGYAIRINGLKIEASEAVARLCQDALQIVGMAGYRNGTPFSVGRHIRDSLSCSLMIANERIHQTNAQLLQIQREI